MSSYQSMRDSSIAGRLRALSPEAGPKSGDKSTKVAVVERTGPKVAEEVLHTEGKTVKPRLDRAPRKAGGRCGKASGGSASDMDRADKPAPEAQQDKMREAMERSATRATGGKVSHDDRAEDMKMMTEGHPDEKQDKAMIRKMVKPGALTGKKDGGRTARADGGRTKAKGSTTINIVMPTGGGDKPMPVPVPMGGAPAPAPMPRPAPQMPPQGVSPTLALKTGGRANFTAGAGSGEGRLEKTDHAKARK